MTDEQHDDRIVDAAADAIERRIRHLRNAFGECLAKLEPLEAIALLTELLTEQIARFPADERAQMIAAISAELREPPDA